MIILRITILKYTLITYIVTHIVTVLRYMSISTELYNINLCTSFIKLILNINACINLIYLHSCLNVKYSVRCLHSWFPLNRNNVVGWHNFKAHK